jgi:ABC-type dipeptide/oligopeptide/nickel transport system permease component
VLRLLARRVAIAAPVLFGVTVLVFLILHLIPGDPAQILLFGSRPTPEQLVQLRVQPASTSRCRAVLRIRRPAPARGPGRPSSRAADRRRSPRAFPTLFS